MIREIFYLFNSPVNPPANWKELGIELNYGKDQFPNGQTVTITDWDWVRENYDLINNYIESGLTGGEGIFVAIPFRIDITNGVDTKTVFSGYLDLTDGFTNKDKIRAIATAKTHNSVDWLNDVAPSVSFEYLYSIGRISNDDFKFMPYVINSVPNYMQAAMATLMVYTISQELKKAIKEIEELIADVSNPLTTVNGILKAIIKVAYLVTLLATLVKLVEDMYKFLISPVKYHAGMYVRDLMRIGCEHFGLTLKSDIWESSSPYYNEFIIPEKLYNPVNKSDKTILGFLTPDKTEQIGYYKGTFAQLIDAMKLKYNAKIVITQDNELYFIRRDKNAKPPTYQMPPIYVPEKAYNTDELVSNYIIEYGYDTMDKNTVQEYLGTIFQVITEPTTFSNRRLVMTKNYTQVSIPFAQAKTKRTLTVPETILKDFFTGFDFLVNILVGGVNALITAVNGVIKGLNAIIKAFKLVGIKVNWQINTIPKLPKSNLKNTIENRLGMMMLEQDNFQTPKIMILSEGSQAKLNKIHTNNDTIQSAKSMWERFHYVNSFVPSNDRPTANQYIIKSYSKVPFNWNDFVKVFTNNRIFASDGITPAIIESLKFYPYKGGGTAEIRLRISELYTTNLKEKYLEPNGL